MTPEKFRELYSSLLEREQTCFKRSKENHKAGLEYQSAVEEGKYRAYQDARYMVINLLFSLFPELHKEEAGE